MKGYWMESKWAEMSKKTTVFLMEALSVRKWVKQLAERWEKRRES
jgi:hypothetical protein